MKASPVQPVRYDSGPNMTPLVDVVMVILIFLMLAGSFGTSEHYLVSTTPPDGVGAPSTAKTTDAEPVSIELQVNPYGGVRVPGHAAVIADRAELTDTLTRLLSRITTEAGRKNSDVRLVLRSDGGVEWGTLAPIYDAALGAKFEKIAFATSW
jgi:biopolymer transport protein ExbD